MGCGGGGEGGGGVEGDGGGGHCGGLWWLGWRGVGSGGSFMLFLEGWWRKEGDIVFLCGVGALEKLLVG